MGPNSGCQRNVVKCVVAWGIYGRVVLYKAWEELAEVVGINGSKALLSPFTSTIGLHCGQQVMALRRRHQVPVGEALLGRVIDGFGRPLDGRELPEVCWKDYDAMPPPAMVRQPISQPLMTGIRAIDSVATCGEGQRVGIFLLLAWAKARFWRCCVMRQTQTAMFWC